MVCRVYVCGYLRGIHTHTFKTPALPHFCKHDLLLKAAFEECFPWLLQFFFIEQLDVFDLERGIIFMDKELQELFPDTQQRGGNRVVDLLAKVYLTNGEEKWMLVHVEIQGKHDRDFARRMLQYHYRILDRYQVPITAIAIFTGSSKSLADSYHYSFLGTELIYRYNTLHVNDVDEGILLSMNNPFALVILAAQKVLFAGKLPEKELGLQRLTIAKKLIESKLYDHVQIQKFLAFLVNFIHINDDEINSNFEREIDLLTDKTVHMGIMETLEFIHREEGKIAGKAEGRAEANSQTVKNLLASGLLTIKQIAAIVGLPEAYIRNMQKTLSDNSSSFNTF